MDATSVSHTLFKRNHVELIFQLGFIAFLLLVLIRISYGPADGLASRQGSTSAIEDGDAFRQVTYTLITVLFAAMYLALNPKSLPRSASIYQVLILLWLIASSSWSIQPAISFRRAILLGMMFSCVTVAVDTLGVRKIVQCFYTALAIVITVSLVSVPLFHFAIHPPGEADPSIIGCWRGVIYHKNIAGAVCGIGIITFLHHTINRGKWYDYLFLLISLIFMAGTRAKTSIGFLLPAIAIGLVFRLMWRTPRGRVFFLVSAMVVTGIGGLLAVAFADKIADVWSDPMAFTGRTTIWKTTLMEISDHPLLGAGYSSFWAAGRSSTLYRYMSQPFLEFIGQSHNGFLEVTVAGGLIGLVLALLAAVIVPIGQLFEWSNRDLRTRSLLLTVIIFCICVNLLEAQLYTKDKQVWILYCVAVLMTQLWKKQKYNRLERSASSMGRDPLLA